MKNRVTDQHNHSKAFILSFGYVPSASIKFNIVSIIITFHKKLVT